MTIETEFEYMTDLAPLKERFEKMKSGMPWPESVRTLSANWPTGTYRIPIIPHLWAKIQAGANRQTFDLLYWHADPFQNSCSTTHCIAGWTTHLAGEAGRRLEIETHSTLVAAALIHLASCPWATRLPRYWPNEYPGGGKMHMIHEDIEKLNKLGLAEIASFAAEEAAYYEALR